MEYQTKCGEAAAETHSDRLQSKVNVLNEQMRTTLGILRSLVSRAFGESPPQGGTNAPTQLRPVPSGKIGVIEYGLQEGLELGDEINDLAKKLSSIA